MASTLLKWSEQLSRALWFNNDRIRVTRIIFRVRYITFSRVYNSEINKGKTTLAGVAISPENEVTFVRSAYFF